MVNNTYVLMESALGFSLFRVIEAEEIAIDALSKSMKKFNSFKGIVNLESFQAFTDQEQALISMNKISEGLLSEPLLLFLKTSIPSLNSTKDLKKSGNTICLGIADANLGNAILDQFSKAKKKKLFTCRCDEIVLEIIRGCRQYLGLFIKGQQNNDSFNISNIEHSYIALGHSYSRAKIKYNVNRVDNMIIQAICILDQIDKDINTYCMRCKEWYGWHFPELTKLVSDQIQYCKVIRVIKEKGSLKVLFDDKAANNEKAVQLRKDLIEAVNGEEDTVDEIIEVARTSMGIEVSKIDMIEMQIFATRIVKLAEFRVNLYAYLCERMENCAPNLTALIGEQVGARLISKAGSLIKLAKYPASTLQILGAEKALFRALKSKGKCNTPKYGLIYNSTFIMKAKDKNKGRISRYLANKAAMAVRLDCFLDKPTNLYGQAFRGQVEERLAFFKSGKVPNKNIDVMTKVRMQIEIDNESESGSGEDVDMIQTTPPNTESTEEALKKAKKERKREKKRKRKLEESESMEPSKKQKIEKKKKSKKKKQKKDKMQVTEEVSEEVDESVIVKKKKKKKKKKKHKSPKQEV